MGTWISNLDFGREMQPEGTHRGHHHVEEVPGEEKTKGREIGERVLRLSSVQRLKI